MKQSAVLQQKVRQVGQKAFKAGTHPQMWRVHTHGGHFAKLGPMGELGDDTVFDVEINDKYRKMINNGLFGSAVTIISIYRAFYRYVYVPVRDYMDKWIDIKVPADSFDLRKSMHEAIRNKGGSSISNFPFFVVLNTKGIEYAKVVNKIQDDYLKHKGTHTYDHSSKTGNLLDDMGATKGWYDWILLMGRNEAQKVFKTFIQSEIMPLIANVAKILGLKNTDIYNASRQMFHVKFI